MTSGKGNQGMSNKIGGSQGRANGAFRQAPATARSGRERLTTTSRRKTTSALFREIDDLVSLEGESGQRMR
jgi:NAD(P)H-hydrate repair Nnr-like enzyme with NAD(P)H-hydrate dehydratase domain